MVAALQEPPRSTLKPPFRETWVQLALTSKGSPLKRFWPTVWVSCLPSRPLRLSAFRLKTCFLAFSLALTQFPWYVTLSSEDASLPRERLLETRHVRRSRYLLLYSTSIHGISCRPAKGVAYETMAVMVIS